MPTSFDFACRDCDWNGQAIGGEAHTQSRDVSHTCACAKCGHLQDVMVADWNPNLAKNVDPHPFARTIGRCGHSPLLLWKQGRPCPRCGGAMNNTGIAARWD